MTRPRDITKIAERAKAADAKLRTKGAKTADSYQNFAAGMGYGADTLFSGGTYGFNPITRQRTLLEWIHRGSWLGGMAVDVVADDMTKLGFDVLGDMEPDDIEHLDRSIRGLGVYNAINDVVKWSRLYGGAIGVILLEGQNLGTPLRPETVGKQQFRGMLPLDRWMVEPELNDLVRADEKGVRADEVGLPRYYKVVADAPALPRMKIHYSRCLRLEGIRLPYWQRMMENMWGISVIERMFDRMLAFDSTSQGAAQLVFKAFLRVFSIKGLRQIIAAGGQPQAGLMKMVEMMRQTQSNEGITLIDGEDEFQAQSTGAFGGLSDVMLQMAQQVSGSLQIPLVRLLGQSPIGMNATGESDLRTYYDGLDRERETKLNGPMVKIYQVTARSEGIKLPDGFALKARPLWQLTDTEKAAIGTSTTAAVDTAYSSGIVDRHTALKELRQSSKLTNLWTNITDEDIDAAEDEPPPGSLEATAGQLELQNEFAPEPEDGKPNGKMKAKDRVKTRDQMLGDRTVMGLPLVIEHERGDIRNGRQLPFDYGYIRLTDSAERGDQMDVCIGLDAASANAYIIDSYDAHGRFDEHKIMLNYATQESAVKDFSNHYPSRMPVTSEVPRSVLHMWLAGGTDKAQPFVPTIDVHYTSVAKDPKTSCATCHWFDSGLSMCGNAVTMRDPKVPDSPVGGKFVVPTGWCSEWDVS